MAVRLKDIARDVGVSVVTVSKVLRNHTDIGEETRRKVLKRMQELNYRPNLAARALVTGRSYTMGLVVPGLMHPFFAEIANGIATAIRRSGYSLLICTSQGDPEQERVQVDQLAARQVDALLVASAQVDPQRVEYLRELKIPLILLDRRFADLDTHFVGIDDEAAGFIATEHLIERGCRRIAHIRGPERNTVRGRMKGYRAALAKHGLATKADQIVVASEVDDEGEHSGYGAMRALLAKRPRPDAVFCHNDMTALGAIRAILKSGLRVPEDIAVVGCGNLHYTDLLQTPLSSIDQQTGRMGEAAARLALRVVESKGPVASETIQLEPRLVVRRSSAG